MVEFGIDESHDLSHIDPGFTEATIVILEDDSPQNYLYLPLPVR
jgi:hypothetical protein